MKKLTIIVSLVIIASVSIGSWMIAKLFVDNYHHQQTEQQFAKEPPGGGVWKRLSHDQIIEMPEIVVDYAAVLYLNNEPPFDVLIVPADGSEWLVHYDGEIMTIGPGVEGEQ